jgi:hypothetical protein
MLAITIDTPADNTGELTVDPIMRLITRPIPHLTTHRRRTGGQRRSPSSSGFRADNKRDVAAFVLNAVTSTNIQRAISAVNRHQLFEMPHWLEMLANFRRKRAR